MLKFYDVKIQTECGEETEGRISVDFVDGKPDCIIHVHSEDGMSLYSYDSTAKAENLAGMAGGYFFKNNSNELVLVSDDFSIVCEQSR